MASIGRDHDDTVRGRLQVHLHVRDNSTSTWVRSNGYSAIIRNYTTREMQRGNAAMGVLSNIDKLPSVRGMVF